MASRLLRNSLTKRKTRKMNRDQLLERLEAKRAYSVVKFAGESYCLQTLTLKEKGENDLIILDEDGKADISRLTRQGCDLLCRCLVDAETKEPILSPDDWQVWETDTTGLAAKLIREAELLNGIKESGESTVKNSSETGD